MPRHQRKPLRERLENKLIPEPNSGCWLWMGGTNERGYGVMGRGSRGEGFIKAHRAAYLVFVCDPGDQNVLHKCDNPACCNPDHLFLGSLQDNMRDCVSKGRNFVPDNRGERAIWSKLTDEAVAHIKRREMPGRKYAKLYGVSKSAVFNIWRGKSWKSHGEHNNSL